MELVTWDGNWHYTRLPPGEMRAREKKPPVSSSTGLPLQLERTQSKYPPSPPLLLRRAICLAPAAMQ